MGGDRRGTSVSSASSILSALILVLSSFSQSALADRGISQDKEEVKQNLDVERQALLDSEIKKRGVLGTLYEINKELNRITGDMEGMGTQIENAKKSIDSYAHVIANLERIRDAQKEKLKDRLRALYKMGFRGYAEVLLSSQTSSEFSRNMKFIRIIAEKDHQLISNYKINLDLLNSEQAKLRNKVRVYAQFMKTLHEENAKYADQKHRQMMLLDQVNRDGESHMQALKEWREAGRKLEEKLVKLGLESQGSTDLIRGTFFEQKGILKAPVSGTVLQKYGIMTNEKFNTKIFHKGLFFSIHPKEKVSAVFFGKVAYSGWIDGYGETIIIDHGDHYYSLYAHNAKLEKRSGEDVESGETIASAGDTGSLRGPGLYFEVRHFSESLDPMPWLDLPKASRL
jgi:septal ring factor EnvC (AmiA/AmiB activator)